MLLSSFFYLVLSRFQRAYMTVFIVSMRPWFVFDDLQ
jgi:hypothetical protein